ncbi:MAG TPA: pro-sigmaK processing inhibitor BofA family protein [Halococcus sp.]|nr:pro-sigmaK processing inhibitor BofA family protein [Halococcus sp.]
MVTGLELAILVLAVFLLLGAVRILQAIRPLFVNTVVGLVVFLVASWLGIGVEIDWLSLLVVAIGGLPGAVVVVLLSVLGVAFVPGFLPFFAA